MDPDQLRSLVQDCIAKHLYSTAVFYADKLVTLTQYAPGDVYLVAQVTHSTAAAAKQHWKQKQSSKPLCTTSAVALLQLPCCGVA